MLTLPLLTVLMLSGSPGPHRSQTAGAEYTFDDPAGGNDPTLTSYGPGAERAAGPRVTDGELRLLESQWMLSAAAAFPEPETGLWREIEVSWSMAMTDQTEGVGLLWMTRRSNPSAATPPHLDAWERPDRAGCLGVGFDASDPPTDDPFRGSGNIYSRPEHEVSLHWDGLEIVKRVTTTEFRDDELHDCRVLIRWVTGGAEIDVTIDDEKIYEHFFIADATPYAGHPVLGARNSERAGDVTLDDLSIQCTGPLRSPAPSAAVTVTAIDHFLNDASHPHCSAVVRFPEDTAPFGRITCTLALDEPEAGFDAWDRLASIYVYSETDERFEILRYITPYHKGHRWSVDVSSFRPLLTGKRRIELHCSTQGKGWVVSVLFRFWPGPTERVAYRIQNLWSGQPEIGNPEAPANDFYSEKLVSIDRQAIALEVRLVVTGHGMEPNSRNAAEFMPIGRVLTVGDQQFRNRLWKADNYLNPCRPQGGTWKYDRAGWGPGDVVRPWVVDFPLPEERAATIRIGYRLDPYVNENRGKTWAPYHRTESQVVFYRRP